MSSRELSDPEEPANKRVARVPTLTIDILQRIAFHCGRPWLGQRGKTETVPQLLYARLYYIDNTKRRVPDVGFSLLVCEVISSTWDSIFAEFGYWPNTLAQTLLAMFSMQHIFSLVHGDLHGHNVALSLLSPRTQLRSAPTAGLRIDGK